MASAETSFSLGSFKPKEPYHIPGYRGYCSQFKYKINDTFGKTTHDLLTAPDIPRSNRSVLAPIGQDRNKHVLEDQRRTLIQSRARNQGDQKYGLQMVPGYTGYVPRGQHYFGDGYADFTQCAFAHMESDQIEYERKMKRLHQLATRKEGMDASEVAKLQDPGKLLTKRPKIKLPLTVKNPKPKAYFSPKAMQHSLSPFVMREDHPGKYFMTGYTGFVPGAREYIGLGYPKITNGALCQFNVKQEQLRSTMDKPVIVEREEVVVTDTKPIYHKTSGMVPRYTGHIPGEKFRYGMTFGHSTINATAKK